VCKIEKLASIPYKFSKKEELNNRTIENLSKSDENYLEKFYKES
jgi:hypothetical protein